MADLLPREGMLATVRNRRAVITSVEEFPGAEGEVSRLVDLQYMDATAPPVDQVLWEHEPNADVVEPRRLPRVDEEGPMLLRDFQAVLRAARWLALTPLVGKEGLPEGAFPVAAPLHGAIQVEDYQLLPLVRALKMPRVTLALFDDVGLGKSIEAGLILEELILKRRIRRVLVLCPAWLRHQWQEELKNKFSLTCDIVDRQETQALRRRLGMDTNPWRTYQRAVVSYHYLKQPDVLADFLAVCQTQSAGSATLPWDLLIVDEAHNCMPSAAGDDSALSRMLSQIARYFEHKIFLSATPHNGYTQCYTGLLEQLDPVRFAKKESLTAAEKRRAEEIVIRRLKREINEADDKAGRTPRFVERHLEPLPLFFSQEETALSQAFESFRTALKMQFARGKKGEQMAAHFAVEVLAKRLLSCPYSFADSWTRFRSGLDEDEEATDAEVRSAEKAAREELDDDAESEGRVAYASRVTGAWLRRVREPLAKQIAAIDAALEGLGLVVENDYLQHPVDDARFDRLLSLIKERLREGKEWRQDERLIIFTEYKTTLGYLLSRLNKEFPKEAEGRIRVLYGGMSDHEREDIKRAFNDPDDPCRLLLATDAASEGANLQETARYLLHFCCPWNPSRLDQRNGRLDRHGQARDVHVFHFTSETDADIRFLGKVLGKIESVRDDLGAVNELFDAAFRRRMIDLQPEKEVFGQLEMAIEKIGAPKKRRTREEVPKTPISTNREEEQAIEWFRRELDLAPEHIRQVLEVALGLRSSSFKLEGPDERGRYRFPAIPDRWRDLIDNEVRLATRGKETGPLPALLFDGEKQIQLRSGRRVFRPAKDTILMHLGHPLMRAALLHLSQARFPGTPEAQASSRWIVTKGNVPSGKDALVLVTVEEMALNDLRETVHHWVRTLRFAVAGDSVGLLADHLPALNDHPADVDFDHVKQARDIWMDADPVVRKALQNHGSILTSKITDALAKELKEEERSQRGLFKERRQETEKQLKRELRDLDKELKDLIDDQNGDLFSGDDAFKELDNKVTDLGAEQERRRRHHQEMQVFLDTEEERILSQLLPRRYQLNGDTQVFPVTVEIRFPGGQS